MSDWFGDWDIGDLFDSGAETGGDMAIPDGAYVTAEEAAMNAAQGGADGGGFWDSAGRWISNNAGTLLRGVTALGGPALGTSANSNAAQQAAAASTEAARINADAAIRAAQMQIDANKEARGEMAAARDRGIAAIRAGTAGYESTIAPLLTERPVVLPTYRGMTDAQRIGREDLIRQGQTNLATSGLRGAGRAGIGAVMDQDRRYIASAVDRSDADRLAAHRAARTSADSARSGLAQVKAQEGGSIANTEIGQGNRIGESLSSDGRALAAGETGAASATAGGVSQAGQANANASLANAGLWNDALGTLGSVLAGSAKEANRDRYASTGGMI